MPSEARQFLLTTGWLFLRHGQRQRAKRIFAALVEADARDGVAVAALAELMLDDGEAHRVLDILRSADFPAELSHAEAVLETRALRMLGRNGEASSRWRRYLEARKGAARQWVG